MNNISTIEDLNKNNVLRIAFIVDTCEPFYRGGYERRAWEVARSMAKKHEVYVFTSCNRNCVIDSVNFISVRKQRPTFSKSGFRKPISSIRFVFGLLQLNKSKYKFDVVDCNATPFLHVPMSARLAKRWGASMILTAHEGLLGSLDNYVGDRVSFFRLRPLSLKITKHLYSRAMNCGEVIVATGGFAAEDIRNEGHHNVFTNNCGISHISSRKTQYSRRATFVGRLEPNKRVEVLILSAIAAAERGYLHSLKIVGDGSQLDQLTQLVRAKNAEKYIEFVGEVAELEKFKILQTETDVFASASTREGISIATLEALSMGNPVIVSTETSSSPNGSLEYVRDRVNGYVTDGSVEDLLNAFKFFDELQDGLYGELSQNALQTAQKYQWSDAVEAIEMIYRNLTDNKRFK